MRKKIGLTLIALLLLNAPATYSVPSCDHVQSCTKTNITGGCKIALVTIQCDGTEWSKNPLCTTVNYPCVQDCCCECLSDGYNIGWWDPCIQTLRNESFHCNGCG